MEDVLAKTTKTFQVGRDVNTGRIVPVDYAKTHKSSTVVERMPKAGYGDTKPTKK